MLQKIIAITLKCSGKIYLSKPCYDSRPDSLHCTNKEVSKTKMNMKIATMNVQKYIREAL
jgi:hypothetical protein